jgi:putative transposase
MPHHVTQRGNRRDDVFFCDADRQRFLQLLLEYSGKHGLSTLAYCLMTNHVHLVCVPQAASSLSGTFKPVNLRYAQHVNWTQRLGGRLWQGRFFSCALDERHLRTAVRYVERNPVRARMVRKAERYAWSSAAAHCGSRADPLLSPLPPGDWPAPSEWAAWLAQGDEERAVTVLRQCTRTGRPAGDKSFVARLESLLGRRLWPRPAGRPRNEQKQEQK